MVEIEGFEPSTSCMPCMRSSQLSYIPVSQQTDYVIAAFGHYPPLAEAKLSALLYNQDLIC